MFILPKDFSKKNQMLAFQITGLNMTEKTTQIDEDVPSRVIHSFTVYTDGKMELIKPVFDSFPIEERDKFKPEERSFPEGFLDNRIIDALVATCPSYKIGKVIYEVGDNIIPVRIAAFIMNVFFESVVKGYYSGNYTMPTITEEFIKEAETLLDHSDVSKLGDMSPELVKLQIVKFLNDYIGHEYFNMVWKQ